MKLSDEIHDALIHTEFMQNAEELNKDQRRTVDAKLIHIMSLLDELDDYVSVQLEVKNVNS